MGTRVPSTRQAKASGSPRRRAPRSHSAGLSSGTMYLGDYTITYNNLQRHFPTQLEKPCWPHFLQGRLAGPAPHGSPAPSWGHEPFPPPTPTLASWKAAGLHPRPLTLHLLKATTAPSHTHTPHPAFISRDNKASKANILSFTTKMWTLQGNEAIIIVKSRRLPWLTSTSKELLLV